MIKPTVGRVVWYTPHVDSDARWDKEQPLSASIAYVHGDRCVNIAYIDQAGVSHPSTSVKLLQDGDAKPESGCYCEWMPYQKGQAAKTEQLEAAAAQAPTA